MKLKNKKTGKIGDYYIGSNRLHPIVVYVVAISEREAAGYDSVQEFVNDWEDAPEEIKPFEEVAKVGFVVAMTAEKTIEDRHGRVDKIEVADLDYYEILPDGTKKTRFTWDEAMEIEKKTHGKWRVPTVPEWFAICAAFGRSENGTVVDPLTLHETLGLATNENGYGDYWSAASCSTTYAYNLDFSSTSLSPRSSGNKDSGFAVRCVAGGGE